MQCRKLESIATHTRLEFDQRLHVKRTNFPVKQILLQVRDYYQSYYQSKYKL